MEWQNARARGVPFPVAIPGFGSALLIRDAQGRAKLMVLTGTKDDFSGPSMLTTVKRNGKRYVSSLAIQYLGAKLEYQVPRQKTEAGELREASVQNIPSARPRGWSLFPVHIRYPISALTG
jgi:hypothetical protein